MAAAPLWVSARQHLRLSAAGERGGERAARTAYHLTCVNGVGDTSAEPIGPDLA